MTEYLDPAVVCRLVTLCEHLRTHKTFTVDQSIRDSFALLSSILLKKICYDELLESPRRCDSNRLPQHYGFHGEITFYHFNTNPRFPAFLLYEPPRVKTNVLHMRKQRSRSASR